MYLLRIRYFAGTTDEIPQSGIEFIGDASLEADIEVISMAVEALKRSGTKFLQN